MIVSSNSSDSGVLASAIEAVLQAIGNADNDGKSTLSHLLLSRAAADSLSDPSTSRYIPQPFLRIRERDQPCEHLLVQLLISRRRVADLFPLACEPVADPLLLHSSLNPKSSLWWMLEKRTKTSPSNLSLSLFEESTRSSPSITRPTRPTPGPTEPRSQLPTRGSTPFLPSSATLPSCQRSLEPILSSIQDSTPTLSSLDVLPTRDPTPLLLSSSTFPTTPG